VRNFEPGWLIPRPGVLFVLCVSFLVCMSPSARAQEKSDKSSQTTKLRIEVTAGEKNLPVENASVYVKYVHERTLAKDKKIEMNVKTNRAGVATAPPVPRGKVLVQVVAEGWKTFGRWFDLTEDEQTIKIKLEKPPRWY
jgi:hypothetical protein